ARPRAAGRALGPHVPGARCRPAVLGHHMVDRPRGVPGGHRHLGQWPNAAPVDVQDSVIPATMIPATPAARAGAKNSRPPAPGQRSDILPVLRAGAVSKELECAVAFEARADVFPSAD